MKLRYFVMGLIFALAGSVANAQVFEMFYQGFETTEQVRFTLSPSSNMVYDSTLKTSGERSLKLLQSTTVNDTLISDTIDFTTNTTLQYIALEFDHMCNLAVNSGDDIKVGKVFYKLAGQSDWRNMRTVNYKGSCVEYRTTFTFSKNSYDEWNHSVMTNDYWKSERFDIDDIMTGSVAPSDRKFLIMFVLYRKTTAGAPNGGWWLDNVRLRSSRNPMITPTIDMRVYPDGGSLPSSRGARIELVPSTTVAQGICPDSVYVVYTVGSDPTPIRLPMTGRTVNSPVFGTHTRYMARIPFAGYDTLMRFYCVAKDNTSNFNAVTFPLAANSWIEYRCVRGVGQPGIQTAGFVGTSNENGIPFPAKADGKSEWVYDSTLLAEAGYGPGAMLAMRYTVDANNTLQTRPKFQVRMKNIPTSYTQNPSADNLQVPFTTDYMQIVYDSSYTIDEVGAGVERTITLQDTFFYAGKDILVQVIYDGSSNMGSTTVKTIPTAPYKKSLLIRDGDANFGFNAYTSENMMISDDVIAKRPAMVLTSAANQPLVYDMGISAIEFPNETSPIVSQPSYVDVKLKNYGVKTVNAIDISYTIDDTINGTYSWTGALAGGAETTVRVATGVTLPAGYHFVRSWVEDSLTSAGARLRDHEPYNDTMFAEFIACAGPMHGVRNIGGPTPDFNNIEEFLFSLSQCGVNDSLVVKLAAGDYPPFSMPFVSGLSAQNYIAFEPAAGAVVTIRDNGVATDMVNMENTPYVRLRNLRMVRSVGALDNVIKMGENSTACRVEGCTLIDSIDNPPSSLRIDAMINTGFANNVLIHDNTITGGDIGVDLAGQASDNRSQHNRVLNNIFYRQFSSAVKVGNQSNVTVDRNEMYDVMSNSSYVLVVMNCYDSVNITRNKLYTSHGGQALGVSNVNGTSALRALIANNMVVCADDGLANQQNTPFNIIQGSWIDVVFNSIKMTAPDRNNVATATFGGGTMLSNSRFLNNIVACYDQSNYAFNFMASGDATNTVGHNVYYSEGYILNRRLGAGFTNLDSWKQDITMDSSSVSLNPTFLNGSLVDLRTYNRLVKGVGTPLATVPLDMFDTVRSTTAPCPGAFEFVSLYYDFEPEALLNPSADNCDMPDNVEMVLVLRNSGTNNYVRSSSLTLSVGYSVNGSTPATFTVTRNIPAEDTIVLNTGRMFQMPANGIYDSVYNVKVWTISPNDPNQTNDTNVFRVVSRYHAAAPSDITHSIPYNTADTIVAQGITMWEIYDAATAPQVPSVVYWYYSPDGDDPFQTGTTYITDVLRQDTHFYVRQHREIPIVRITQVQLFRADTVIGLTDPMPEWIHPNTKVVVELTNVGDDTAYLEGDTVQFISPTSGANNKKIKIPAGVMLLPGESIVIQFHNTSGLNHQLPYMLQVREQPNIVYNTDFAVLYRSSGVKDAVAFNNIIQQSAWNNAHVPSYVWSGNGLPLANATYAGVVRCGFSGTSSDWLYSNVNNPMHLGVVDQSWLRYTANNCEGDVGVITVQMANPPVVDIEVDILPIESGCGLGNEPVSVHVQNFGVQAANNVQLNYESRGVTVSETLSTPIAAGGDTVYVFNTPLNMVVSDDTVLNITAWVTPMVDDYMHSNDTSRIDVLVSHTPTAPVYPDTVYFDYATSDTLMLVVDSLSTPIWYDYSGAAVDTGSMYVTDLLYSEGTIGVSLLHHKNSKVQIGNLASVTNKTAYPSPYQMSSKFSKQQYIYSASELLAQGVLPGAISGISFYLDSLHCTATVTRDSAVLNLFEIYIGQTSDTIFSSNTAWKSTQRVFSRTDMPIYRSSSHGWIDHQFDSVIMWDGQQSVVVQIVSELSMANSTGIQTSYTAKPNTTLHKNQNSAVGANFTGQGTKGGNRPDIMFLAKVYGCEGPQKHINVALNGVPDTDATILLPDGADTVVYNSCGNMSLPVIVRNMGRNVISGYKLYYIIDGDSADSTVVNHNVIGGASDNVMLFQRHLSPGHHMVTAVVRVLGDSVSSNDTLHTSFNVRFCAGDYTISSDDSTADYHSFNEALDTLRVAGIDGPVVFHVAGGIYQEQLVLDQVEGSSPINTITFRGAADSAAVLIAANTAQANYIINIDGLSNIILDSMHIVSRPASGNNGHVMTIQNSSNITIQNSELRVKSSIINQNASCIVLQGNVSHLNLLYNVIDSGYYSLTYANNTDGYSNITIQHNTLQNFHFGSVNLKGLTSLDISSNYISSNHRGKLTAISIENVSGNVMVQKNHIYLIGALTGTSSVIDNNGKRGIELKNVTGTNQQWAYVINNMIGLNSNGTTGVDPCGIFVDGASGYISVYYNSVRVYAGAADVNKSKAFYCGAQTNHLQVMNNIFSNFSRSYAYYVTSSSNISASDYNAYFAAGDKFAYWGGADRADLTELQVAGGRDGSSVNDEPYFAADDDLHLLMTNYVSKGQYNTDVVDDIDGNIRHQIPAPTIGAHEMERINHNMSVVRIISPVMPVNTNQPNDIESDSVLVKASFYNNGNSTETRVNWYAYIISDSIHTVTAVRNLGVFASGQMKTDSVWMPTILGIIDTQMVRVVVTVTDANNQNIDNDTSDNHLETPVYLAPAYDLEAVRLTVPTGCSLQNSQISMTIKNAGFKEIPAGVQFEMGFHAQGYHPNIQNNNLNANKIYISTMPDTVREFHTFSTPLARNSSRDFPFTGLANLYPTDTALNIKVRVNGWCRYSYDVSRGNDSTKLQSSSSPQVDSWYTPDAPIGNDTIFAYGTWGEVTASQVNSRPIRWHRDSTTSAFYSVNNYLNSRKWSTTPQFFHDSTYYLQCFSDKNCPSHFSPVHVTVQPRVANDMAVESVLAPLGGRVYMENDTVRVRIANYGTVSQSDIPVVYQLRKGNNTNPIQTVYDTCRATIAAGGTYVFTFGTLLDFHQPATQSGNFQLRVWTDLVGDQTRRNDTIRYVNQLRPSNINSIALDYPLQTKGDSYTYPAVGTDDGFDFIRVAFNEIDVDLPPLGRHFTNFGNFSMPEYQVLHVRRGLTDTLQLMAVSATDPNERTRCNVAAYIDFNRSGSFEDDPSETVLSQYTLQTNSLLKTAVSIPSTASLGYMRMRVVVTAYENNVNSTLTNEGASVKGHVVDFLLFVDSEPPAVDLAFTQINSPRSFSIADDTPVPVSFRVSNKGTSPITRFTVNYSFTGDTVDSTSSGSFEHNGVLAPGASSIITIPPHVFPIGTSNLRIWHTLTGDTVLTNNSISYQYHRFHVIQLIMDDNFDSLNWWYAPMGYNNYSRNLWQAGTPQKSHIQSAFSEPVAWVTDTLSIVATGRRGNVSYLYSPVINIAQIRPDTIAMRVLRNLTGGSSLRVEFFNHERNWVNLYHDSILVNWYNDADAQAFTGTSSGNAYNRYFCPSDHWLAGDYNERLQFRLVYTAPQGDNDNASFGDGCAVDDFHIGRARRPVDLGVIAVTKPIAPRYGETIYPEVVVKNFGTDTATSVQIGYTRFGASLAAISTFGDIRIPPEGVDTFLCQDPFIITSDFPDTFYITAFTISTADIFDDNDTTVQMFHLSPLDNDISAEEFVAPLDRVIAGDSTVVVTMRVRNFGLSPIDDATLTYVVNDDYTVTEYVDFNQVLGRQLQSTESFNYTFQQRFRAPMGMMRLMGIVKNDMNDYLYNDTINKRILGISSISDLAAASIVKDTSMINKIRFGLTIDNRGARGANGFEVGFWVDNDTSTIYRTTYSSSLPIAALTSGYILFDTLLERRAAPYDYVTAYVYINDDNDRTNDTTNLIIDKFVDLEAVNVVVEENAGDDCRVFLRLRNVANFTFDRPINLKATINGNSLSYNGVTHRIEPMQSVLLEFPRTIPKDPNRHYVGEGHFTYVADTNGNNQTSDIVVVNYVESVPEVGAGQLLLGQNYPNPFNNITSLPFTLPNAGEAEIFVMDALGHIVFTIHGRYPAGSNIVSVDMSHLAAGVYYYGISVDGERQMRKMILR